MSYSISDFTSLVLSKSAEAPTLMRNNGLACSMYWAATELWLSEYTTWHALASTLGIDNSAAVCAWQRRTAYSEIASVLLHAW
jgi:hypothetical protein